MIKTQYNFRLLALSPDLDIVLIKPEDQAFGQFPVFSIKLKNFVKNGARTAREYFRCERETSVFPCSLKSPKCRSKGDHHTLQTGPSCFCDSLARRCHDLKRALAIILS